MNSYNCKDIYKYYKREGGKLDYNIFKQIISENNKRTCTLIINTGYEYRLPNNLGIIRVVGNERKLHITENNTIRGAINWGESNKLKAKLLSEGRVLYECTKDDKGNIISDNGGEKWLVYFIDKYSYIIIWKSDLLLHNSSKYKFTPTWSNARALSSSINEDSEIIYKQTKTDGTGKCNLIKKLNSKNRTAVRTEG